MFAGYEDLTNRTVNTLHVVARAGLNPLRWRCKCNVCGTEQVISHIRLQAGVRCANSHVAVKPAPSNGSTGTIAPAIRSRDAEEAARYIREHINPIPNPELERLIEEVGKWPRSVRGL